MKLVNKILVLFGLRLSEADLEISKVKAKHFHPSMKVSDRGALTKDVQACLRDKTNEL